MSPDRFRDQFKVIHHAPRKHSFRHAVVFPWRCKPNSRGLIGLSPRIPDSQPTAGLSDYGKLAVRSGWEQPNQLDVRVLHFSVVGIDIQGLAVRLIECVLYAYCHLPKSWLSPRA